MITKNYTANRTETPGAATSTIPAAMANYWINGVNSLISDLTPLKDAGGFYAPVDFNIFRVSNYIASPIPQNPSKIPLTKVSGGLSLAGNEIVFEKGFLYKIIVFLGIDGNATVAFNLYSSAGAGILQRSFIGGKTNQAPGFGTFDLTGSSSNVNVSLRNYYAEAGTAVTESYGGIDITKYKLIPFTAAT